MKKEDFERQINSLVPQSDPELTDSLFTLGQELEEEFERDCAQDLANSLSFISRHFNPEIVQGVYEIIRYGSALPDEMIAAAVYLENGSTSQDAAEMARAGQLMCFHWPKNAEELSPLALCVLTEGGQSRSFYTLHFGEFEPAAALRSAQRYAGSRKISVTDALLSLTTDMVPDSNGGAKKILVSNDPDMTQAMSAVFGQCAAVAARISIDADRGQTAVEYNPLWLELRRQPESAQAGMALRM